MLLTAILFSLGGFINGVFAKSFDDISIVPTFVIMPLTYLGGVFFSIESLPAVWRDVSLLNPIFYMINAFRANVLGVYDIDVGYSLLVIACLLVVTMIAALNLLKRGAGIRT